jgi:CMP/dCMP kinase
VAAASLLIAIDGPAGAGKSAAARELAYRLHLPYLDTGAMYRGVALTAWRHGVHFPLDGDGERRVAELAQALALRFAGDARAQRVFLGGEDVTEALRTPEVSQLASQVSVVPAVRRVMVERQRELASRTGGVVEGRDIGTVVFPDAAVKFFLTADPVVRARRRFEELRKRSLDVTWDEVVAEQRERDLRDTSRAHSPLIPSPNAIVIDTSVLSLEQVVSKLLAFTHTSLDRENRRPV